MTAATHRPRPASPGRRRVLLMALAGILAACGRPPAPRTSDGPPQRVASQALLADEILWDLGPIVRARVVAVSALADDPRYTPYPARWPNRIPRAATASEQLLALAPDLVIMGSFTAPETRAQVAGAGVPVLVLDPLTGFDGYRGAVVRIADRVGARAEGRALVERFDRELAAASRPVPEDAPGVLSFSDGVVAGAGTTFDDAARAAGLRNLAADRGLRGHSRPTLEQITSWDPQALVIPCDEDGDCARARARVADLPGLSATRAVRQGRVFAIPAPILHATGRAMIDLVRALSEVHAP